MNVTMGATEARKFFFDLLTAARYKNQVTSVLLNGELCAEIRPIKKKKFNWKKYWGKLNKAEKVLHQADWSDLGEFRKNFKFKKW